MKLKGLFTGDWHYGLSVEDLDRTPDVHKAVEFIVEQAIKNKVDFVSIGGDLTNDNTPLADHLALLIGVLNRLNAAGILVLITRGNHCSISAPNRYWALTPLERIGYENVKFYLAPELIKLEDGQQFLMMPHATKSQAIEHGFKTAQEFLDTRAEQLLEKVKGKVTVISHYNVNGCKIGTENLMLRQTDLQLPAIIQRSPKVIKIINSHIHTYQHNKKMIMPGSPICTDFGDLESPKGFLIGELENDEWTFKQILTPSSPMQFIELDFVKATQKEITSTIAAAKKTVLPDSIVKLRVTINEENVALVDFDKLQEEFAKGARYVKQIDRVITRKRQVRDPNQKADLSAIDAVKQYISFRKPEGADRKLALAKRFLEGEEVKPKESGHEFLSSTAASDSLDENLKNLKKKQTAWPKTTKMAKEAIKDFDSDFDDIGAPSLDL